MMIGTLPMAVPASSADTPSAASLICATREVSGWSLAHQANETVVVSINAMNVGAVAPAARAGFGGILLFGERASPAMSTTMTALQRMTPGHVTMMVMTDEEGGGVMRLTNVVNSFPWPQAMGRTMSTGQISSVGSRVGQQLMSVGVNTDLAPVLDLDGQPVWPGATNPDGLRSFGAAPRKTAVDAAAFARGLSRSGVLSVAKHFPGLGGSTGNTDYGPAQTKSWSSLQSSGLIPFRQVLADGVRAVMLSNASVPGLTSLPASLSSAVVSILRNQMNFTGLIMTDSLTAGAIGALHLSPSQAAAAALEAGADQVLAGATTGPAQSLALATAMSRAIQAAVISGALARATLVAAAAHVVDAHNSLICAPLTT